MKISKVVVLGAGTMGVGVAVAAAQTNRSVILVDNDPDKLIGIEAKIEFALKLQTLIKKGSAPQMPYSDVVKNITATQDLDLLSDADLVIECVTEELSVKRRIFETIDSTCASHAIFTSNTSCIPIDTIAGWTTRSDRVIGTHFMNPAHIRNGIEMAVGSKTSEETVATVTSFLEEMGKTVVRVKDGPGFVINRVLMMTINQAIEVCSEGLASAADVDKLFVNCLGHATGPLATADLIGLDVIKDSLMVLQDIYQSDKYRPCELLCEMVEARK